MKKLTFKELLIINSGMIELTKVKGPFNPQTGHYELDPRPLGPVLGLKSARVMAVLTPILDDYTEQRRKLVEAYTDGSKADEKGNRPLKKGKTAEAFDKDERALQEVSHPFAAPEFTVSELSQSWVTADIFFKLRPIISDFDAKPETADGPKKDEQAA